MERDDLEWKSAIADARLRVAEELGWYASILGAYIIGLKFEWWAGVLALYPIYYVLTLRFRKAAAAAEDAYFKDAQIGRYAPYLRQQKED